MVFLLLLIFFFQSLLASLYLPAKDDEQNHIAIGYYLSKEGKYFVTGHTPFLYILESIPFYFTDFIMPYNHNQLYLENKVQEFGRKLFYESGNNPDQILLIARIPIILISVLLGFYIFKWANELYGVKTGLLALFLYSFEPTILAYSRIAMTDMLAAAFIFISVYYFWRFYKNQSIKNLLLTALFFSLAFTSKFTALFLLPFFLLMSIIIVYGTKNLLKVGIYNKNKLKKLLVYFYSIIIIILIGYFTINLFYGFDGFLTPLGVNIDKDPSLYFNHSVYNSEKITERLTFSENSVLRKSVYFFVNKFPEMISYHYIKDFYAITSIMRNSKHTLFGTEFLGYDFQYILLFLIKVPIPLLLLILLSLIFYRKVKSKNNLDEYFLLIPIILLLLYFGFKQKGEIAQFRYLLPIFPFIFVFISKIINIRFKIKNSSKMVLFTIGILLGWYIISSAAAFPNHLGYYNEFIYKNSQLYDKPYALHLLDSGPDLKLLKEYLDKNNIQKINLSYIGNVYPSYYGINYDCMPTADSNFYTFMNCKADCSPKKGTVVITSYQLLNKSCYGWLRNYEPKRIGATFIYH